jgi:hypothetical protein
LNPGAPGRADGNKSSSDPDTSDRKGITVKLCICLVLAATIMSGFWSVANAEKVDLEILRELTGKFDFAIEYGDATTGKLKFIYTDNSNHVHIYRYDGGYMDMDWEQTNLGSRVSSMYVAELYGDGRPMLVIATIGGRILVYDMDGYDLVWENLQDPFEVIYYMVSENLDRDPQHELVILTNNKLVIYDSLTHTFEWVSQRPIPPAKQMKLANMDNDPQLEIILSSGLILDSKFYTVEFEANKPFGARIFLFDLNGDGIPEIFGESPDFTLRVFDRYSEREIW